MLYTNYLEFKYTYEVVNRVLLEVFVNYYNIYINGITRFQSAYSVFNTAIVMALFSV